MKKRNEKRYTSPPKRNLDPRSWPGAPDRKKVVRPKDYELGDFKVPLYAAMFLGLVALAYLFIFKPAVTRKMDAQNFKECRERLLDVKVAIEKSREDKPAYETSGIFSAMGKQTNTHVEYWVAEHCMGRQREAWYMSENVQFPSANAYYVYGRAKTHPPCLITVTPQQIWPMDIKGCGNPLPAELRQ